MKVRHMCHQICLSFESTHGYFLYFVGKTGVIINEDSSDNSSLMFLFYEETLKRIIANLVIWWTQLLTTGIRGRLKRI